MAGRRGRRARPADRCRGLRGVARRPDIEALSPTPRSEFQQAAETAVNGFVERLRAAGVEAEADVRSGLVTPGVLLYAEEKDADVIVCGGSTRGRVARRMLGSVPVDLIGRSRRPVLVITPP